MNKDSDTHEIILKHLTFMSLEYQKKRKKERAEENFEKNNSLKLSKFE